VWSLRLYAICMSMRNTCIDRDKYKIIHFSLPMAIRRGCSGGAGGGEGGGGGGRGGALQFTHVWEFGRTVPDQSKLVPRRLICSVVVVVTKKFNSKANFLGPDRVAGRIRCVVHCMSTSTSHVPCSMSHAPWPMSRLYGHQIGAKLHTHPAVDC